MHDFRTLEGQDRQKEQSHCLMNAGLAGGALVLLSLATARWPLPAGVGL